MRGILKAWAALRMQLAPMQILRLLTNTTTVVCGRCHKPLLHGKAVNFVYVHLLVSPLTPSHSNEM